jgi:hypothetical protein
MNSPKVKRGILIAAGVGLVGVAVAYVVSSMKKKGSPVSCVSFGRGYYIQASNSKQISGNRNGALSLSDNKLSWERWAFEDSVTAPTKEVNVRNTQHNLYLQALSNQSADANTEKPNTWESFKIECLPDGKIALLGFHGRYMGLNKDASAIVNTATTVGPNEMFTLISA